MKLKLLSLIFAVSVLMIGCSHANSKKSNTPNHDVVKSSLYGFVIGDALGVPVEFTDRETLTKDPVTSMRGHGTYDMPEGTWSDDTSMTLATMDSIIQNNGQLNYTDIADKFCSWLDDAQYTATGVMFDVGNATKNALTRYKEGNSDSFRCTHIDINQNGNGSLMRMLPIALCCHYNKFNDTEILNATEDASSITHPHEISLMGCYIYTRYVMSLLDGNDKVEAYNFIRSLDYSMFSEETAAMYSRILKQDISKLPLDEVKSAGNVFNTLEAVMWLTLNYDNYTDSVLAAVNLGDDTDTIAAITGSISGILYGYDAINSEWIDTLKNKEYLDKIIDRFENTFHIQTSK